MLGGVELKRRREHGEVVWKRDPAQRASSPSLPHAARQGRRARRGAIWWGVLGFVLGAGFWNAVGLWAFVGGVFLQTPADRVLAPGCTALVLDREAQRTEASPCPDGTAFNLQTLTAQLRHAPPKANTTGMR